MSNNDKIYDWSFSPRKLLKPDLIRAREEGRAAAMQGLAFNNCPYLTAIERDQVGAWEQGYKSYRVGPVDIAVEVPGLGSCQVPLNVSVAK